MDGWKIEEGFSYSSIVDHTWGETRRDMSNLASEQINQCCMIVYRMTICLDENAPKRDSILMYQKILK